MDQARLQTIYEDSGAPGAQAFRLAVRRKGGQISEADARAFVAKQATGQITKNRIPSDGKIVGSVREDHRWQMDIIDFSKRIAKINAQNRYVLVAVDNFNRQLFTAPMGRKSAQQTLEAFKRLIRANAGIMPKEITVDQDGAFATVDAEITSKGGCAEKEGHACRL